MCANFIRDVKLAPELNRHLLEDVLFICKTQLVFNYLYNSITITLHTLISCTAAPIILYACIIITTIIYIGPGI